MTALLAALAFLTFAPDVSKEDVKKLVAAGVSDDVVVAYIRTHGPTPALSAEDMIELRNAHVSDRVLAAMVVASKAPPSESPEPPGNVEPDVDAWAYPYGATADYYYGPYFWWYVGPGSPLYRYWPYRWVHRPYPCPYGYHYYHYPRYPYGYHWSPIVPHTTREYPRPQTPPARPPAAPHSTPKGGPRR